MRFSITNVVFIFKIFPILLSYIFSKNMFSQNNEIIPNIVQTFPTSLALLQMEKHQIRRKKQERKKKNKAGF